MIKASGQLVADKIHAAAKALHAIHEGHHKRSAAYYAELRQQREQAQAQAKGGK